MHRRHLAPMTLARRPHRFFRRHVLEGRAAGLLLAAGALAACGPKPPDEQLDKGGESVASWAATGTYVGEQWLADRVPTPYARLSLRSGARQVRKARATLAEVAGGDSLARAALARYDSLSSALEHLGDAVDRGEHGTAARLVAQLSEEKHAVERIRERTKTRR